MDTGQEKIRSLWIPMRNMNLLLPNIVVAEIGSYREPVDVPGTPDWMLGTVKWQDSEIPVISLETLCGMETEDNQVFSRLMIVNSVRPESPVSHYAIVTSGLPGMIQFSGDMATDVKAYQGDALKCTVEIGSEEASIPDLDYLQGLLEEQFSEAA